MSDYTVSIGMIVKNEEKYMRMCLDALKPLMENVNCELVIVDTGSVDRTVEIAKEYTDKIYHFEWINDFSAARNFGLLKCTGEWFMFVDADTIFDDSMKNMAPMIEFFNDKDFNKAYLSATYITRNYFKPGAKEYAEHKEHRITRRTEELRFIGSIHESFNCGLENIYMLDTYSHHYGYAFANIIEAEKKSQRNCDLLWKELNKSPDDLRLICLIHDSTVKFSDKKALTERMMKSAKVSSHPYAPTAYLRGIRFYSTCEYDLALKYADEFISRCRDDATLIDVYYIVASIEETRNNYEKAYNAFKKCLKLQKLYNEKKLNMLTLTFVTLDNIGKKSETDVFRHNIFCLANLGRNDELIALWLDEYKRFDFPIALSVLENAVLINSYFAAYTIIYDHVAKNEPDGIEAYEKFLEQQYYDQKCNEKFVEELSKGEGKFSKLMTLVKNCDEPDFMEQAEQFLDGLKWRSGYSELVYLFMKKNYDIKILLSYLSYNHIKECIGFIANAHSDFSSLVCDNYRLADFTNNIIEVVWLVSLLEAVVFGEEPPDKNSASLIYEGYARALAIYVTNLYNPNLLNEDDIRALPDLHRFGYYMALALEHRDEGNNLEYVRGLKKALLSFEDAKDIINSMISDL